MHLFKSKESIGMLFGIFAYLSFSILDVIQKTLILHHSIFQLLLIKYLNDIQTIGSETKVFPCHDWPFKEGSERALSKRALKVA